MSEIVQRGPKIGGTIIAAILCPVVLALVAMVVGGLWAMMNVTLTVIRPGVIGFFAAILGGVIGTFAARKGCDAVLRAYHRPSIFVELCIIAAAGLLFELSLPITTDRIAPIAQLVAILFTGFGLFWKEEPV